MDPKYICWEAEQRYEQGRRKARQRQQLNLGPAIRRLRKQRSA